MEHATVGGIVLKGWEMVACPCRANCAADSVPRMFTLGYDGKAFQAKISELQAKRGDSEETHLGVPGNGCGERVGPKTLNFRLSNTSRSMLTVLPAERLTGSAQAE